jgi:hypothetical protein
MVADGGRGRRVIDAKHGSDQILQRGQFVVGVGILINQQVLELGLKLLDQARHWRNQVKLRVDQEISSRLASKYILDILVEGERWLNLHKLFGPLSGFEGKIDNLGFGLSPRCFATGAIWVPRKRPGRLRI